VKIERKRYFDLYGPTVGDSLRLADTDLWITLEKDLISHGDELVFGAGKTSRDGIGVYPLASKEEEMDLVITNVIVMDPVIGIIKADVGIKDGLIAGIGHAGNPFTMDGVTMVVGGGTEVLSGEGLIATPGFIDSHVHWIAPQQTYDAISAGFTTIVGGGTGPVEGTKATTATPGKWNIEMMLKALDQMPINVGLTGKGVSSRPELERQIESGVLGFKVHEDWGAMPRMIDETLTVADEYDV